ncbi:MAG TPA: alpha/beta hydrolase [Alphaproteobacteria bacterium]|nr:alpha/beta hydrolase [Alphaproteobacteria bacterium]
MKFSRTSHFGSISIICAFIALTACAPRVEPAGEAMSTPALAADEYVASDGAKLPIQRWLPDVPQGDPPKAVILGLHGMNDYANAFAMPGAWWAQHGIATYAYDQRGFGRAPHPGYWPGEATLVGDLDAMVGLLHARYPGTPLYLLGESMGGAVVMAAMARPDRPKVDGVILSAPAVWGRTTMDIGKQVALWASAHTVPWWTVTGKGLDITPSDNREMLVALSRDPLVIKETRIDAIWGLVNLMDDALAVAPKLDGVPVLILYGEHDEVIPKDPTLIMIEHLPPFPTAPRTIAVYPKGYHMLLRDLEAKTLWEDVLHWVDDPRAPLPSGDDRVGIQALEGQ